MGIELPQPTIDRLSRIYTLLAQLEESGKDQISSSAMGGLSGLSPQSIRKDISIAGWMGSNGSRYDVRRLKAHLAARFGFSVQRRACVVGLGRLGSAMLDYAQPGLHGYAIMAGFDSNMNTIETKKTQVRLYPAYQIAEVVKREKIELAVLCVPAEAAQLSVDRLIEGGIRGIVNFTPAVITCDKDDIFVSQIDIVKEFRILSAMISLSETAAKES
ncbi:MAG: redox-sensing transcriptional repressor Rex [Spirochaetota bacterium]